MVVQNRAVRPKPEPRVAPPQVTDVEVNIVMDATPSVAGWVGTEKFKDLIANKLDSFAHPSWTVNYKTATLLNGELSIREIDKAGPYHRPVITAEIQTSSN